MSWIAPSRPEDKDETLVDIVGRLQRLIDETLAVRKQLYVFGQGQPDKSEAKRFCTEVSTVFRDAKRSCKTLTRETKASRKRLLLLLNDELDDMHDDMNKERRRQGGDGYRGSVFGSMSRRWQSRYRALKRRIGLAEYEHDALIFEVAKAEMVFDDWLADTQFWRRSL